MNDWRVELMDDEDFREAAAQFNEAVCEDLSMLVGRVDSHADAITESLQLNEHVVREIQSEINLIWSVLELPWYRRMRRLGRTFALALREKSEGSND